MAEDKDWAELTGNQSWYPYLKLLAASAQDGDEHTPIPEEENLDALNVKELGVPSEVTGVKTAKKPAPDDYVGAVARRASTTASDSFSDTLSDSVRSALESKFGMPIDSPPDLTEIEKTNEERERKILALIGVDSYGSETDRIEYFPTWLTTDVLLQGRVYLTDRCLIFYANLPGLNPSEVINASSLKLKTSSLTGIRSVYVRYWFILRQNALCYYSSSGDIYFPMGIINLHDVDHLETIPKSGDPTFTLHMKDGKKYKFRADNANSAHEWSKYLLKELFRCQNNGDHVIIRVPYQNIVCTTTGSIHDLAQTLRYTVLMGPFDANAPVDESNVQNYVFTFFVGGPESIAKMNHTVEQRTAENKHQPVFDKPHVIDIHKTVFQPVVHSVEDSTPAYTRRPFYETSFGEFVTDGDAVATDMPPYQATAKESENRNRKHDHESQASGETSPTIASSNSSKTTSAVATPSAPLSPSSSRQLTPLTSFLHLPKLASNILSRDHEEGEAAKDGERPSLAKEITERTTHTLKHSVQKLSFWPGEGEGEHTPEDESHAHGHEEDHAHHDHHTTMVDHAESSARFRDHFGLDRSTTLIGSLLCTLKRSKESLLPYRGKIYLSSEYVCFRYPGGLAKSEMRMIVPMSDVGDVIVNSDGTVELVVLESGAGKIELEFKTEDDRNKAVSIIKREATLSRFKKGGYREEENALRAARLVTYENSLGQRLHHRIPPVIFDSYSSDFQESFLTHPMQQLTITLLTIGSRGDVQPYIALALGLQAEGHNVRIASHAEYKDYVEGYGIGFREIAGDPSALMSIMIEHGSFSVSMIKDAASKFRGWVSSLLESSWEACQDTDLLIESPSAMAGIHIAEALQIPYFRAFTMPWTRTHAYPHAFIVPSQKMGGSYNYLTYVMFDNLFWRGISKQVNKWRKETLKIPSTSLEGMHQQEVPFLYCVSPTVLVPPLDQPDWIHITGYWDIPADKDSKDHEDEGLVKFIAKARELNKKIVYIGFGSILVNDAAKLTENVVGAVEDSGVFCVLARGWSQRGSDSPSKEHIRSEWIYEVDSVPHTWLFPQIDAVVHHGGSGTTGCGLRFGKPTIIRPFFGDQFFYAQRLEDLGVGIHLSKISRQSLGKALTDIVGDPSYSTKAKLMGEQISSEHGVDNAIKCIYRELQYAKLATHNRTRRNDLNIPGVSDLVPHHPGEVADSTTSSSGAVTSTVSKLIPNPHQITSGGLKLPQASWLRLSKGTKTASVHHSSSLSTSVSNSTLRTKDSHDHSHSSRNSRRTSFDSYSEDQSRPPSPVFDPDRSSHHAAFSLN